MKKLIFAFFALLILPSVASAASAESVSISLFDEDGTEITNFLPFGEDYRGIASITSGDTGTDGTEEIVVGSGPGLPPMVKIFRQDGSMINEFLAYQATYQGGITVAVCDLNGDSIPEIVTGTMSGGGPHVRIFAADGDVLYRGGFFAYADDFRGGANVACGDIDGDGRDDIVTSAGLGGGPHIKVFDPYGNLKFETFAGSASENTGATVATGDIDGDGDDEIIAGRMGAGDPTVFVFDNKGGELHSLLSFNAFEDYTSGILVTAADIDNDGVDEIGVSTSKHDPGIIKFFEMTGTEASSITPFENDVEKGLVVAPIKNGNKNSLVVMSASPRIGSDLGKYITVDISDQRLYAYENGVLVNSFLISSGLYGYDTPFGKTEVMAKLPVHNYVWSYGEGNPNNYNIPNVKWNLRFRKHYYIHGAFWHNNFGNRMSHGCINVHYDDAEWIYNWANVGTTVEIVK